MLLFLLKRNQRLDDVIFFCLHHMKRMLAQSSVERPDKSKGKGQKSKMTT
jgi:hypothetical protein